jgi:uncharacterized membrane protein YeaQ/YmgE (transglycosylase-associated protein family)
MTSKKESIGASAHHGGQPKHESGMEDRFGAEKNMSILAWIVLGLIAGFIASKIVNKQGEGFLVDIVLGVVGAIAGGYIFSVFGAAGVTGFNLYSIIVAVIGAIVVLMVYHALRRAV